MTTYGDLITLRRPPAGYADADTALIPAVAPGPEPARRDPLDGWLSWTPADRLLLPIALWLAGSTGPGRHRWAGGRHRARPGDPPRPVTAPDTRGTWRRRAPRAAGHMRGGTPR